MTILLLLTIFSGNVAHSQNTDTLDKILQVQTSEDGDVFDLLQKNIDYDSLANQQPLVWYIKCLTEQGQKSATILLDTMTMGWGYHGRSDLFKGPGGVYTPSIFFLNKNIGFVYGSFKAYGDKPFILRTVNGGKSWQKTDSLPHCIYGIRRGDFSMMDTQHGFFFLPHQYGVEDSVSYFITKNQGQTWQQKRIPLNVKDYDVVKYDVLFDKYGQITIVVYLMNATNLNKFIIFQSTNFGETFSILK